MRATRRYWAVATLAAALLLLAVLAARPLLLVGAAGLAGLLLAAQFAFLRALRRTDDAVTIRQATDRDRATAGETVTVTLVVSTPDGAPLDLTVAAGLPVAASATGDATVALGRHAETARVSLPVTVPVAGTVAFEPPTVTAADPLGLLTETLQRGPTPTLTVEPPGPHDVHVGEAGDALAGPFGSHETGWPGRGVEPTELREYAPGDPASLVDWKATARLQSAYVREDEVATDRSTAILIDHRSSMAVGPPGETKLDYLRAVALGIVAAAREHGDPLGCVAVGDGGLTHRRPPRANPAVYDAVRRTLHDLDPTSPTADSHPPTRSGPTAAGAAADRLSTDGSPFGRTLEPFLEASSAYVDRVDRDPLFAAARTVLGRVRGDLWTVLLTDDSDPAAVRETARVARRGAGRVAVLLAPTVLFEPGGLADLEAAYDRYAAFETFRGELAGMDQVAAFEVAPGDRLHAVLDAGRRRTGGAPA